MKGEKNAGGGGGGWTVPSKSHNLSAWGWWKGDVIFLGGGNPFGHIAIVDDGVDQWGVRRGATVIEAVPSGGVQRRGDLNPWANAYPTVEGYHVNTYWGV
jgi:hypothetical protein